MINYKVLSRKSDTHNWTIYYLTSEEFIYKKTINVFKVESLKINVFKDIDSLLPNTKFYNLNEKLYSELDYIQVQDFFSLIQDYNNNNNNFDSKLLLKDLERILLYWDDYI